MRGVILGLGGGWGTVSLGSQGRVRSAWSHRDGQSQPGVTGMGQNQVAVKVTKGRKLSRFLELGQDGVMGRVRGLTH